MDPARITALPLFADVDGADVRALAEAASEQQVPAGDYVVRDGDFGYTVFLIEEGTAEVVKDGRLLVVLGPGDVFGEIAVERSGRRTADVRAATDLRLVAVLNRDLWRVERRLPAIRDRLRATAHERALSQQVLGPDDVDG